MKKMISLLLLVGVSLSIVSATGNLAEEVSVIVDSGTTEKIKQDESIYEILYQERSEIYNKITNTVYWALGGMLTVLLMVVGGNFYIADVRSKSNKAELKNELSEDIKKELNVIDKERRDYELLIDEKIKNMMKSVGKDREGLLSDIDSRLADVIKIEGRINSLCEEKINKVKREVVYLNRDILVMEADSRLNRSSPVPSNALSGYFSALKIALDNKIQYSWILDKIEKILTKHVIKITMSYNKDDMISILDQIESKTATVHNIKEKINVLQFH